MSELSGNRGGAPQEGVPPASSQEPIRANQDVRALPTDSASVISISTPGAPSSERPIPIITTVDAPTVPYVVASEAQAFEGATILPDGDKPETTEKARDATDDSDAYMVYADKEGRTIIEFQPTLPEILTSSEVSLDTGGERTRDTDEFDDGFVGSVRFPERDDKKDTPEPGSDDDASRHGEPRYEVPDPRPDESAPQPDLHEPIDAEWEETFPDDGKGESEEGREPLTADAIEKTLSPVDQLRLGLLRDTIMRPVFLGDTEAGTYIGSSTVDLDDWMDPPRPDHIQHQAVALDTPNTINVLYITRSDRRTLDEAKTGRLLWALAGDRISPQEMFALYNEGHFSKLTGKVYRPDGWEWNEG